MISIKYHLPRLWGAELPDRGLRAAAPAVFEVSSLPYVVDQFGAETGQAFAAGVADAPVDNAISANREQFLGEGLRFLITVRIKQGAEFGAILTDIREQPGKIRQVGPDLHVSVEYSHFG